MRRLIINADDFGLTAGINRAIRKAHGDGIVTSTTLMANAAAFDDAVRAAAASPLLSVGCHIVLVDGSPVLDHSLVPSLVTRTNSTTPRFRDQLGGFFLKGLAGRLDPEQIEAEVTAQIRKLQSAGLAVTHIDTHKHTHTIPAVWQAILRAAKACGVRALRNPFSPPRSLPFSQLKRRPRLWQRHLEVSLLRTLSTSFRRAVREAGLVTPDGSYGIVETGDLDLELFLANLETIPEGTWEFVCHPGYCDADLDSIRTRLRQSRTRETELLTSPAAREALSQRGITLISYRELAAGS